MRPQLGLIIMCGQDCLRDGSAVSQALDGHPRDGLPLGGYPVAGRLGVVDAEDRTGRAQSKGANVHALVERLRSAEREIAQLQEALTSQRLIGVAIGLLAHRFSCSPEQSWQLLVRLSQTSNVKVREVARILVDAHAGRDAAADADVLASLASQLPGDGRPIWDGTPKDGAALWRK